MNAAVAIGACLCSLLQCAVIAGAVELVLRAVPRLNAATRHRTWLLVLAAAPALPFADLAVRADPAAHLARPAHAFAAFIVAQPVAFAALGLWALASMLSFARLWLSLRNLALLRERSGTVSPAVEAHVVRRARELGLRRPVCVRSSNEITSPIALGFVRGTILIPERLLPTLSEEERDFVFVHELAHLRRRDGITNLVAKLVRAALIWNPVLLFVERRAAFEREVACDATVLAKCGRAQRYARCLAAAMLFSGAPSTAMPFVRLPQVLRRIELVLHGRRAAPRLAVPGIAAVIATAVFLAVSIPGMVALDMATAAGHASQPAADVLPPGAVVVPAAFRIAPAAVPTALPFTDGRLFALRT